MEKEEKNFGGWASKVVEQGVYNGTCGRLTEMHEHQTISVQPRQGGRWRSTEARLHCLGFSWQIWKDL